jgi:hypothetical protein
VARDRLAGARVDGRQEAYALAAHAELVRALMTTRPDLTLDELKARLAGAGVVVGRSSIGRFLLAWG